MERVDFSGDVHDWEQWAQPYSAMLKLTRRANPRFALYRSIVQEDMAVISLMDLFEARRRTTPPQLKRCVLAIVKDLTGDNIEAATREDVSKAFAICTKQFQKYGYLEIGTQKPTGKGKAAGKKKAAEKEHGTKVAEFEKMLAAVRKGKEEDRGSVWKMQLRESGLDVMNVANVPLEKARPLVAAVLSKYSRDIDKDLPVFDAAYAALQKKVKSAFDIPREQMPVIRQMDLKDLDKRLKEGRIDIFQPWAKGVLYAPTTLKVNEKGEWLELGLKDGSKTDDIVRAQWTSLPAGSLLPTQKEIWLEKLAVEIGKNGPPRSGSSVTDTTIIVSGDNYILDGHHRWGQVMLTDPDMKMKVLIVPIPIKTLVRIGKTYGEALGNKPRK